MIKKIKNVNGQDFEFEVLDVGGGVSVLEPGYVITPNGNFIPVGKNEDHNIVFSDYINKYLDKKIVEIYQSTESMLALVKINHIVYYGLRMNDLGTIYNNGGNIEGLGLLILPENYQETMTEEQKESVKVLLDSNTSIFSNREKMKVEIHETVYGEEINKEEFQNFLESSQERKK